MTSVLAVVGFYGRPPLSVALTSRTIYDLGTSANAAYQIVNDGTVQNWSGGVLENWLQGSGASASSYEVRATLTAGTLTSGSGTGAWLNCGTSRFWLLSNSARNNSIKTAVLTIDIRLASAPAIILATAQITLQAESESVGDRGTQ